MNSLKNKSYKTFDYISRYANIPYYYNTLDNKYISGITKWLSEDIEYLVHNVDRDDSLDKLSYYYYGRPDLYWVIADFNRITDCFSNLTKYKTLKIPNITGLRYD